MKNVLSLNGCWQVAGFEEGKGNWAGAESPLPDDVKPIGGQVPGEVHIDLLRAGVIPDPYYALNAVDIQWIEEKEWWYKRSFEVEEDFLRKQTLLEFDGLDTFATVYLNGRELGKTDNMFIPHSFDVTGLIHAGTNVVAVRFDPTAKVLDRMDYSPYGACFNTARVLARKQQCAFGWDWTHRFVGAGIWREAALVSYDLVSIADLKIDTEIEGGYANAWITIEVANHVEQEQSVTASVVVAIGEASEKLEITEVIPPFGGEMEVVIRIEEPELWWPNGFGDQPIYKCLVGLQIEGEIQDVAERKFGVREVDFVEMDEYGNNTFTLMINGREVFCKGANFIPADHFPSNASPKRLRELIRLTKDCGFNMLRVWGGGIYERPEFYDACDEMGIMVWQDFMFACATYPDDNDFARKVADETRWVVRHLRSHPSVVVWCGNNECEMGQSPDARWQGKRLFHEIIPTVLDELDTSRPYRPCSPWGGKFGNDPTVGNWHGGAWFPTYQNDENRWREIIEEQDGLFVAEFYAQGAPEIESLRRFIPEDKLFPPDNEMWEFHNKDNPHSGRQDGKSHQGILIDMTRRMMGEFGNVEEFAAWSGILQGEFVKAEFEHHRREKWHISGSIYWMFNDCWPAVGWSLIDYYLKPKPAYYYAKRACSPVILSFKPVEDRVQLYITSDDRSHNVDGVCRLGIYEFGSCELKTQNFHITLPANTSRAVWESDPVSELLTDPERQCLVAMLESKTGTVAKATYFPLLFKNMRFPKPKLLIGREMLDEKTARLTVASDDYARNLALMGLPPDARPSDNYFDLLPSELYTVTIENITEEDAKKLAFTMWGR